MEKDQEKRRSFLKHILAGAAVVAGTVTMKKKANAKPLLDQEDTKDVLYRESDDFKKYYRSMR